MAAADPPTTQPLGKPAGSVLAYLAIGILAAFLLTHALAAGWLLHDGNVEAAIGLLGALALEAGTVTGFYFGSRSARTGATAANTDA